MVDEAVPTPDKDTRKVYAKAFSRTKYMLYQNTIPIVFGSWGLDIASNNTTKFRTWLCEEYTPPGGDSTQSGITWSLLSNPNPDFDPQLSEDPVLNPRLIPVSPDLSPGPDNHYSSAMYLYAGNEGAQRLFLLARELSPSWQPNPGKVFVLETNNGVSEWRLIGNLSDLFLYNIIEGNGRVIRCCNGRLLLCANETYMYNIGQTFSPADELIILVPSHGHGMYAVGPRSWCYAGNDRVSYVWGDVGLGVNFVLGAYGQRCYGQVYVGASPDNDGNYDPASTVVFETITYSTIDGTVPTGHPNTYNADASTNRYRDGHTWVVNTVPKSFLPPGEFLLDYYGEDTIKQMIVAGLVQLGGHISTTYRSGSRDPYGPIDVLPMGGAVYFNCKVKHINLNIGSSYLNTYPLPTAEDLIFSYTGNSTMVNNSPSQTASFTITGWMEEFGYTRNEATGIKYDLTGFFGTQSDGNCHIGRTRVLQGTKLSVPGSRLRYSFGSWSFNQTTTTYMYDGFQISADAGNTWAEGYQGDYIFIVVSPRDTSPKTVVGTDPYQQKVTIIPYLGMTNLPALSAPGAAIDIDSWTEGGGSFGASEVTIDNFTTILRDRLVLSGDMALVDYVINITIPVAPGEDPSDWTFDPALCDVTNGYLINLSRNPLPIMYAGQSSWTVTLTYMSQPRWKLVNGRYWSPTPEDEAKGGLYALEAGDLGQVPSTHPVTSGGVVVEEYLYSGAQAYGILTSDLDVDEDYGTSTPVLPNQQMVFETVFLQNGELDTYYIDAINVIGGNWPFTFTLTDGELPPGVTLTGTSGVLSGVIPEVAETKSYGFSISVTDHSTPAQTISGSFSILVQSP